MNGRTLPIDYTNLDYPALREAMLALAKESLPEWTDFSENDLGVLLIELFAYACDITLYYQNRIASNLFPATADEPEALIQLLRLIGYELRSPSPAIAPLRIAFNASEPTPILIPARTQFSVSLTSGEQIIFETEKDLQIENDRLTPPDPVTNFRYFLPLEVVQGQSVLNETVGVANGQPNQMYALTQPQVIQGSIQVRVNEPGGPTFWQEVDTLANSSSSDRHFMVQRNAAAISTLVFGDRVNGMIPPAGTVANPVIIEATYRVLGDVLGNVPAGSNFQSTLPIIQEASNIQAAGGGSEAEDLERARLFAPRLFRTQERAVTVDDYIDLALQVPGVGKAKAMALNWNQVVLYVAPTGQVADPSELLVRDLQAFFESRRLLTTSLIIVGPTPADIYLRAKVRAQPYYRQIDVRVAVEVAIADYLAFETVEFGQFIYLSKVYEAIQNLPQVASLTVTQFSRSPNAGVDIDIESDGILDLQPNELPRPGYRDNPNTPPNPADPTYRPAIATIIEGGVQ